LLLWKIKYLSIYLLLLLLFYYTIIIIIVIINITIASICRSFMQQQMKYSPILNLSPKSTTQVICNFFYTEVNLQFGSIVLASGTSERTIINNGNSVVSRMFAYFRWKSVKEVQSLCERVHFFHIFDKFKPDFFTSFLNSISVWVNSKTTSLNFVDLTMHVTVISFYLTTYLL